MEKNFKNEIKKFMSKAQDTIKGLLATYGCKTVEELEDLKVKKGIKSLYPKVYYARKKNGRHGVTLPAVYSHGGSAIDLPKELNSLAWAICFAMKVEEVLEMGNYTYFEWVKSHGWLSHGISKDDTGEEYIRRKGKRYEVVAPATGDGYDIVPYSKEEPYFPDIYSAVFRRNQVLYSFIKSGKDRMGKIPVDRIAKYKRILCKGYFKAIDPENVSREHIASAFRNSANYCGDDETLAKAMRFFGTLAMGKITKDSKSLKFALKNMRVVREYFAAIELDSRVVKVFKNNAYDDLAKLGVKPVDKSHRPMSMDETTKAVEALRKHFNCKY